MLASVVGMARGACCVPARRFGIASVEGLLDATLEELAGSFCHGGVSQAAAARPGRARGLTRQPRRRSNTLEQSTTARSRLNVSSGDQRNRSSGAFSHSRISVCILHLLCSTAHHSCGRNCRGDYGEVRKVCVEERGIDDAAPKEGDAQERLWPKGKKPQASHRDRPQRGPEEGREGSAHEAIARGDSSHAKAG